MAVAYSRFLSNFLIRVPFVQMVSFNKEIPLKRDKGYYWRNYIVPPTLKPKPYTPRPRISSLCTYYLVVVRGTHISSVQVRGECNFCPKHENPNDCWGLLDTCVVAPLQHIHVYVYIYINTPFYPGTSL